MNIPNYIIYNHHFSRVQSSNAPNYSSIFIIFYKYFKSISSNSFSFSESISNNPINSPFLCIGITISDFDLDEHAIWPSNYSTLATTID